MIKAYFSLSVNNLRRRKLRSILTMIGIFIGIAAVVSLISLGDGLKQAVTGQFSTLSADNLIIQNSGTGFGPPGSTAIRKLTSNDLDIVKKINGVTEAIPRLLRIAKVEYNKNVGFDYVASIPDDQKQTDLIYTSFAAEVEDGRLLRADDKGKIVVGSEIAQSDNFDKEIRVGTRLVLQGKEFEVVGVLKQSSSFQVNLAILMTEKDMKSLLNIGDEIDLIVAHISDPNIASDVASRIEKAFRKDRNEKIGEEDFSVQTPLQAISSINTVLNIINIIVSGIAAISLIIGGIGIANTMYTSVLERKTEIGTMKAVGARDKDILWIFVLESGLLGLIGGIIGALFGLGMAFLVSGIANSAFGSIILSVQISYPLLALAVGFSFFIGLFSGFFPAYQASKLKPVDALRG